MKVRVTSGGCSLNPQRDHGVIELPDPPESPPAVRPSTEAIPNPVCDGKKCEGKCHWCRVAADGEDYCVKGPGYPTPPAAPARPRRRRAT